MPPLLLPLILILLQAPNPQQQAKASITGYILKMGTGEPLAKTTVMISPFNGGSGESYTATTDADGHFSFQNLDAGQYRLIATKNGFARMEYGARGPSKSGLPVTLTPGQRLADIGMQMIPGGIISGRVFDRDGEPLANANVQALKYTYPEGRRALNVVQTARTNDLGEYRFFWLQPGQYFVGATPVQLQVGGVMNPSPVAGPGIGGAVGFTGPANQNAPPPSARDTLNDQGYIPVYYPGTTDPSGAAPINLTPGIVFSGVDRTAAAIHTLRVQGQIINGATGQPAANAIAMLIQTRGTLVNSANLGARASNNQGVFDIRGVPPGSYEVVANMNERNNRMTAHVPVEVGNADVQTVTVVMMPGFTVSGHLSIDGPQASSQDLTRVRVSLRADGPQPLVYGAAVMADGTFTLEQVGRDNYRITVSGTPQHTYIKSAQYGGMDILNEGIQFDRPPNGPIDIVVSSNTGSITGTVQNEKQEPSVNAMVVLVPDAPKRSRLDMYRTTTTDALGQFHLEGIPPGDYKVFSWEDVETGAWQDPDFIRTFEDRGKPVSVNEGGTSNVDLRVIPSPT
jgi:5-hydroxyisourate hydrolase-like protein (transthyretin family)